MNIGQAVEAMKNGAEVARAGWGRMAPPIACIALSSMVEPPADHPHIWDRIDGPYVYRTGADGAMSLYECTQADLLADDWHAVSE